MTMCSRPFEPQFYAACKEAGTRADAAAPNELRMVERVNPANGHKTIEFSLLASQSKHYKQHGLVKLTARTGEPCIYRWFRLRWTMQSSGNGGKLNLDAFHFRIARRCCGGEIFAT